MSKELDLIKRQQPEIIDGYPTGNIYIGVTKEEATELEKELKALKIIKDKKVNVSLLSCSEWLDFYNQEIAYKEKELTQEEYELLKEVLL